MAKPCPGYRGLDRTKPCRLCGQKHASKTGKRSRRKGKVAERKVAKAYREAGFDARRSIQARGAEESDVVASCFWNEVKDRKAVSCRATWKQAHADAPEDQIPVAITHQPKEEWLVTLRLEDWLAVLSGMRLNMEALRSARAHVFRQQFAGTHEQDKIDAEEWLRRWNAEARAAVRDGEDKTNARK